MISSLRYISRSSKTIPLATQLSYSTRRAFSRTASLHLQELKVISSDSKSITLSGLVSSKSSDVPVTTRFLNLFLRDADPTPGSVDPSTSQKNFSTAEVPSNISIQNSRVVPSIAKSSTTATCIKESEPALEITWSDGLVSLYPYAFLARNATHKRSRGFRYLDQDYVPWSQLSQFEQGSKQLERAEKENRGKLDGSIIPRVSYWDYLNNEKDVYKAVKALHDYGLVFIDNVPEQEGIVYGVKSKAPAMGVGMNTSNDNTASGSVSSNIPDIAEDAKPLVERIAERIGYVKSTFYGKSWNVISIPDPKNVAYSSVYLPLHMDLCYYESPPGVQLLHVIQNSTTGGESLFADSFAAVESIAQKDPEAYDALTRVPITFHYDNDGEHYWYERPLIVEDQYGGINERSGRKFVRAINYSPPFQGPLAGAMLRGSEPATNQQQLTAEEEDLEELQGSQFSEKEIEAFHRGYKLFEDYISDKANQIEVKMEQGTCVLFMNRRTLHARNEFDQNSGKRWFRGTYLDLDAWQSKLRMGVRRYEQNI